MIITILDVGLASRRPAEMLMAPVAGEPMIWRMVERARAARTIAKVICAVSLDPADDGLCGYLTSRGASVLRGDSGDAPGAHARCLRSAGASHAVCIGADTPLLDPGLIDEAVRYATASRADLVTSRNYPRGLEVTVASDTALAQPDAAIPSGFNARRDWSRMDWRADTAAGFAIARAAFEALHAEDAAFGVEAVLDYLDGRPDLARRRDFQAA